MSYFCTIPATVGLQLFWEVNSLQLQSQTIIDGFANLGIFIEDGPNVYESTLVITAQVSAPRGAAEDTGCATWSLKCMYQYKCCVHVHR